MPSIDLTDATVVPVKERMLGDTELDTTNQGDWSHFTDIAKWLALVLAQRPEVASIEYILDWGQGPYGLDVLLKDGTPLILRFPDPEELAVDANDDDEDNDEATEE